MIAADKNSLREEESSAQRGQAVLEYVLLMMVAVALAAIVINLMVSQNKESPGFIIERWQKIINAIGSDIPEKH